MKSVRFYQGIRFCFRLALGLPFIFVAPRLSAQENKPITLHPENPHYFLFRGKPTVAITSGEHYGAVLNLDFDFAKYLDTLQADGLNLTRTFSGAYVEPVGSFNIKSNSLAPAAGRFICPWARSEAPGYGNGGNKFDLTRWNDEYFTRLKQFVFEASKRGIIVEFTLFCPFYEEAQWKLSPQNAINNVNGIGTVPRTNVYTLDKNGGLLAIHEAMVHKIVSELEPFDNVMYEVCNEPYFGGVTLEWQHHIADVIVSAEPANRKHLLTQNIANEKAKIAKPHPAISVFNFHYASPPDTVGMNYGLDKVIGDNETGFKGTNDTHYRMEGWQFILAGGGLYNNLDYSFTVGHEDGTFIYPKTQPGGGNPEFRKQLRILQRFINTFGFVKMHPDKTLIKSGLPEKGRAEVLADPGRQYAIYLFNARNSAALTGAEDKREGAAAELGIDLPAGRYNFDWISPLSGATLKRGSLKHEGGVAMLNSPAFDPDIALKIFSEP